VASTACPGCELVLPAPLAPVAVAPAGSSPACWAVRLEVAAFGLEHPTLLGEHQLLVDAYGAQHAQPGSIRLPYSLVGLHLALEAGWAGLAVRALHGRMGKPRPDWPAFLRPALVGMTTVLGVAEAGARAGSEAGHRAALHTWAAEVWSAYAGQHPAVRALAARFR
jgi:hypothetical protein